MCIAQQSHDAEERFRAIRTLLARRSLAVSEDPAFDGYWIDVAHRVLLPAVIGMALFVDEAAEALSVDRIFFLARDALIIKSAYDVLFPHHGSRTRYLRASRRAFNLAAIEELTDDALGFLVSNSDHLTVAQALDRLDLPQAEVRAAIMQSRLDPSTVVSPDVASQLREALMRLADPILSRAAAERGVLARYLREQDLFARPALVVDLGWHASLQQSLAVLGRAELGRMPDLAGAYMGTFRRRASAVGGEPLVVRGWLFDRHKPSLPAKIVGQSVELFELLFSAPELGTRRFAEVNGRVRALPEMREDPVRLRIAAVLHQAVAAAAPVLASSLTQRDAGMLKSIFIRNAYGLALQPRTIDVARFGAVWHNEHFGVQRFAPIIPLVSASATPEELARAFAQTCWPEGFLRGLSTLQQATLLSALPQDLRETRDRRAAHATADAAAFATIDGRMPLEPEAQLWD